MCMRNVIFEIFSRRYVAKQGFLDVTAHDYELVFGCEVQTGMDKAARLVYGDSLMTHAMVFTGCHEEDGPGKFVLVLIVFS